MRVGYCLNVHPASTREGVIDGLRKITLPLRDRIAPGRPFGVGMYLPASAFEAGRGDRGVPGADLFQGARLLLDELAPLFERERLDAFTWNAFPYGDFHSERLKERVFEPTWLEPARARWTFAVAWLAARLPSPAGPRGHVSISTHTGMHSSSPQAALAPRALAEAFGALTDEWMAQPDPRVVLALEPEPRANCNDTRDVAALFQTAFAGVRSDAQVARHLGVCLDACHAAVEFETPREAMLRAGSCGAGIAKLQLTSAIALREPAKSRSGREALFALAEPRYLHQVSGRMPSASARRLRAGDLPEVAAAYGARASGWADCEEWRCHFHVPIDRADLGVAGLETTRAYTDELLALALAAPHMWGPDELHLEIETYTWDVLPQAARGDGALIDGLEREYRHALRQLDLAGWREETSLAR